MKNRASLRIWPTFFAPILLLVLWFIVTPRFVRELYFPSPQSVWEAVQELGPNLATNAGATFLRVLIGWSLGSATGIAFALCLTRSLVLQEATSPLIEMLRPLPVVTLAPFIILWFGTGPFSQVVLVWLGCFFTLLIHTLAAVNSIPVIYVRTAAVFGASRAQVYRTVVFPAILPTLQSGLQLASALGFGLGAASEFLGAQSGLGFLAMLARRTLNTNTILLATVLISAESYILDAAIRLAFKRLCAWTDKPVDSLRRIDFRVNSLMRR